MNKSTTKANNFLRCPKAKAVFEIVATNIAKQQTYRHQVVENLAET